MTGSMMFPSSFSGPSALDALSDFRRRYTAVMERRAIELREQMDDHASDTPSEEMRRVYEEYDSIRYFESDLHRLIGLFVAEAVKSLQQTIMDIATLHPPSFIRGTTT